MKKVLLAVIISLVGWANTPEKECLKGNGKSCEEIGSLYQMGVGRPYNPQKAFYFYQLGCKNGNPGACVKEGLMLVKGFKGKKGVEKGVRLLTNYCILAKSGRGCGEAGKVLLKEGDVERGAEFLRYGCTMDDGESCYRLGKLYYDGIFRDGFGEWESYYMEGCQLYYFPSCRELIFNRDTSKEMRKKGLEFITKLCQEGVGRGCTLKGEYLLGSGVLQKGIKLLEKGCQLGDGKGCYLLGKLYITGKIVKKDISKGSKLLVEGCKNQYLPSCRLALLVNPESQKELIKFWLHRQTEPMGKKVLRILEKK